MQEKWEFIAFLLVIFSSNIFPWIDRDLGILGMGMIIGLGITLLCHIFFGGMK